MYTNSMKRIITLTAAVFASIAFFALSPVTAKAAEAGKEVSAEQRQMIEQVIQEFLMREPEVIIEAVEQFRMKQAKLAEEKAREAIKTHADFFRSDEVPVAGNPDGDVVLVEFFDYHCGYCKRALADVSTLIKNDKNLRVVFIEFPILSPESEIAAKAALAANDQGKYFEFHQKLMNARGKLNEERLLEIAKEVELDVDAMLKYMEGDKVGEELAKNRQVAAAIGVTGTPAFVIGDEFLRGAAGLADMTEMIKEHRTGKAAN